MVDYILFTCNKARLPKLMCKTLFSPRKLLCRSASKSSPMYLSALTDNVPICKKL